ncbi:hypothetical protein OIE66_09465 [Nonomuraea sp. NBC_01738]|uniref:hypothetical protein n=1 Tax=Nonomuraea sp. NBC_01738 TaxID=2976003 RepID=UPI002E10B935|nr:hypothetical protein OIE66_09465 [Nonomuraea sp. NBC_01738]
MDPRALPPRPVIDPSVPAEISVELRAAPHLLHQARSGKHDRSFNPALVVIIPAFLLLILMLTNTVGMVAAGAGVGLIAVLKWAANDNSNRTVRRRTRLAQQYGAQYVLPDDLDYPCQMLLRRAQDAVDTVLASEVQRAGLLDSIDNRVSLPEETWQISKRLARLSSMHAEHGRIVPSELPSGLEDAFKPYSSALDAAWTSLSQRVRRLEEYALQVLKADEVYEAHLRLDALAARTPDYQRLIADTVRDDLAHRHIRELADQAQQVRELFEKSIDEARQTAGALLRTPFA